MRFVLRVGPSFSELLGADGGKLPYYSDDWKYAVDACKFKKKDIKHVPAYKSGRWDGYVPLSSISGGTLKFPTGLALYVIQSLLSAHADMTVPFGKQLEQVFVSIEFMYDLPGPDGIPARHLDQGILLRPYQERMVDSILNQEGSFFSSMVREVDESLSSNISEIDSVFRINGRGIWKAATGSGKTVSCAGLIGRLAVKTLFVVYSNDLVVQTRDAFKAILRTWLGENGWDVGIASKGVFSPSEVTVAGSSTLLAIMRRPDALVDEVKKAAKEVGKVKGFSYVTKGSKDLASLFKAYVKAVNNPSPGMMNVLTEIWLKMSNLDWEVGTGVDFHLEEVEDKIRFLFEKAFNVFERFIEKSNLELLKTPGQVTDTIQTENNDIFANRKLSEMDSHKIEYGYKHPQLFTQRGIRTSKSSRSHSKITPYTNPFNASKVKRIIDDVEKANKQKIFENYFTGKVRKTKRQPFEHQGMN